MVNKSEISMKNSVKVGSALVGAFMLIGCSSNDSGDNQQEEQQINHSDGRVHESVSIDNNTVLYTVNDDEFRCNIVLNSSYNNAGAGIDCKLTEQGRQQGVEEESIDINDYTKLHILNTDNKPSFVVVNTNWKNVSPAISTP